MRRFWGWTTGLVAALLAAMVASLPTNLGFSLWHYNASFVAAALAALVAWRLLRRRRVATLTMALSGSVATITGFVMLYSKDLPAKEWVTWWHSFTSFALLLTFLVHWIHNNARLTGFTRRLLTRERAAGYTVLGAWVGIALAGAWTWLTDARGLFTRENYLLVSSWTVLMGVSFSYGLWLAFRAPPLRRRLAHPDARNSARSLVDTSLFLSTWGSMLTGLALLWFAAYLRGGNLKYVSKWWHTSTSVAFVALVALHVGFNARLLAAHARRLDAELPPGAS